MLTRFKRLSVATQATVLLASMLLATCVSLYFWAVDNAQQAELAHARNLTDALDTLRSQAGDYNGFYVRRETMVASESTIGRYLASYELDARRPDGGGTSWTFHQKNPFLILGEFCARLSKSGAANRCRMVSDNPFNPANHPDLPELVALTTIRSTDAAEYWTVVDGQLRYTRALTASKACLSCHGDPAKAPEAVRAQYPAPLGSAVVGGGYGYQEGKVVGLTSVSIKHQTPFEMLLNQRFGFWASATFVLLLPMVAFLMILRGVARPLSTLSAYTSELAANDGSRAITPPNLDDHQGESSNEVHMQSFALKSLHETIQAAMSLLNHRPTK